MQRQQHPAQIRDLLQLCRQILTCQQTGHVDGVTEKVVFHGDDLPPQRREPGAGLLQQIAHKRGGGSAGGDGKGCRGLVVVLQPHGAEKVLLQ